MENKKLNTETQNWNEPSTTNVYEIIISPETKVVPV